MKKFPGIKSILILINFLTLSANSQTVLNVSNVNNVTQFEVNSYVQNNFIICAISNRKINTNITARIYIYAKRKDTNGEYTIASTTTSIEPEYGWEEENSTRYYGHTLLVKGKCILKMVSDTTAGDVRIFIVDARENAKKMSNTYFTISFVPYTSLYAGKIVINEVNYDTGYIWQKEWVEFYNNSLHSIDMNNFILQVPLNNDNKITPNNTIPLSTTTIPPYGYLILVANLNYFTNFFHWVTPGEGNYKNVVIVEKDVSTKSFRNNTTTGFYNHTYASGDSMILLDSSTNIVERLDYKHSWKSDIFDISIERRNPNENVNSDENWGGSISPKGCTPGEINSIAIKSTISVNTNKIEYVRLSQNVFNPEKEIIKIYYKIKSSSYVKICIYNSEGDLINELLNESTTPGTYSVDFTGKDRNTNYLAAGIYIVYMQITEKEGKNIIKVSKPVVIGYW